jgi:hypothetical protein
MPPDYNYVCNRQGEAMRAFEKSIICVIWVAPFVGCTQPAEQRHVRPTYDDFTGRLIRLSADQDGDGRIDQWTYLDGNRPLRGEADTDGDGRIDRWEYFDANAALVLIGTSSRNDGIEDVRTYVVAGSDGESHVATARQRDRMFSHHEYFRGGALVRTETDTNTDGRIDKWERYAGSVLREAAFDTTLTSGRPDRRAMYDEKGRFVQVEIDPERDGTFVRVEGVPEPPRSPGVKQP